ncbi:MAG: AmmeMemoRadiSam system protein A [Acidobacteria bacterium]|nr:AmmeMemoRadiSam system protein A [Acidobacteriota bacterium]
MSQMISAEDRCLLLREARHAVSETLAGRRVTPPPAEGVFALPAGVFVSFHKDGRLRGCIGHLDNDQALATVLGRMAVAAATEDPRFEPITAHELAACDIEISVLGRIEAITDPSAVQVGRHGLIAEQHGRRGLLLPQVAVEYGWDRETFLTQTCVKAGLSQDAWKQGATLYTFEAEVFGDHGDLPRPCRA